MVTRGEGRKAPAMPNREARVRRLAFMVTTYYHPNALTGEVVEVETVVDPATTRGRTS